MLVPDGHVQDCEQAALEDLLSPHSRVERPHCGTKWIFGKLGRQVNASLKLFAREDQAAIAPSDPHRLVRQPAHPQRVAIEILVKRTMLQYITTRHAGIPFARRR